MRRSSGRIAAIGKAEVIGSGLAIDIPFPANLSFRERGDAVPTPAAAENSFPLPRRPLRHRVAVSPRIRTNALIFHPVIRTGRTPRQDRENVRTTPNRRLTA